MKKITTPYSFENQDYFTILPFEDKVIQHLENIIKNEKGIFLLYGNQGSGKTSLKNIVVERIEKNENNYENVIVQIPFLVSDKEMYHDILRQTNSGIKRCIEKIVQRTGELSFEHEEKDVVVNYLRREGNNSKNFDLSEILTFTSNLERKIADLKKNQTGLIEEIIVINNIFQEIERKLFETKNKLNGNNFLKFLSLIRKKNLEPYELEKCEHILKK